jgi:anti-sigma B factor antagonist
VIPDGVQVRAERRNGTCVLRISGELDTMTADTLGERADAAVRDVPGPVLVDVSGLTFIDADGARVLNALIQTLPDGRRGAVRSCPRGIRRILDLLGLSLGCPSAGHDAVPEPGMTALLDQVRRARFHAGEARLDVGETLARLTDTCIRLAGTVERADLIREQGRQALAASRTAREHAARARQAGWPQRQAASPPP